MENRIGWKQVAMDTVYLASPDILQNIYRGGRVKLQKMAWETSCHGTQLGFPPMVGTKIVLQ